MTEALPTRHSNCDSVASLRCVHVPRNQRSQSIGTTVHNESESAFTIIGIGKRARIPLRHAVPGAGSARRARQALRPADGADDRRRLDADRYLRVRARPETLRRIGCRERDGGIPAPGISTLHYILKRLDGAEIERLAGEWMAHRTPDGDAVAMDGKIMRGSYDRDLGTGGEPLDEPPQQQPAYSPEVLSGRRRWYRSEFRSSRTARSKAWAMAARRV